MTLAPEKKTSRQSYTALLIYPSLETRGFGLVRYEKTVGLLSVKMSLNARTNVNKAKITQCKTNIHLNLNTQSSTKHTPQINIKYRLLVIGMESEQALLTIHLHKKKHYKYTKLIN